MSLRLDLENLGFLVSEFLQPFSSAALINGESEILGLKYESLPEVGTFAPLIQTIGQYFKPLPGDFILTNDPYAGGTLLSVFSLVTRFQIQDQTFYFAARTRFKPRLTLGKKLDEEGVRIPPTPVYSHGTLNEPLIQAISGHPLAPAEIKERISELIRMMEIQISSLQEWTKTNSRVLSKSTEKEFLAETQTRLIKKIGDLPRGDRTLEISFESGETVRVRCEIKSQEVSFEFAGTGTSQRLFLTSMATFGTCLGALLSFLNEPMIVNQGVFSIINVTTPQGCFLNARYPAPFFEGANEAANMIASTVYQGLSQITSSQPAGMNATIPSVISLEFSPEKIYFDSLAGGTGATPDSHGIDGYYLWDLSHLQMSIEEIERRYPILIRQSGIRQTSGGKGRYTGGNGILREIEVLADCSLKWLLGQRGTHIKGFKAAHSGQTGELSIIKADGEKVPIQELRGSLSLKKGDRVLAASAGGCGFDKNSAKAAAKI